MEGEKISRIEVARVREGAEVTVFFKKYSTNLPSYSRVDGHFKTFFDAFQQFIELVPGWSGFGYAKDQEGNWFYVDIDELRIERKTEDPLTTKSFILAKLIPENEWRGKADDAIPIRFTK